MSSNFNFSQISKFKKGHYSQNKKWMRISCGYAHLHVMSFITTKFQEILLSGFRGVAWRTVSAVFFILAKFQRVIFIFIKCPSANQNQLFYMKYNIYKCKMFQSFQMHNLQIQVLNNTGLIKMFFNPIFHIDLVSQQTPMPKNK